MCRELADTDSVDDAAVKNTKILLDAMRTAVPHKHLQIRPSVPWMTKSLLRLIQRKCAAFKAPGAKIKQPDLVRFLINFEIELDLQ